MGAEKGLGGWVVALSASFTAHKSCWLLTRMTMGFKEQPCPGHVAGGIPHPTFTPPANVKQVRRVLKEANRPWSEFGQPCVDQAVGVTVCHPTSPHQHSGPGPDLQ
jgi:hypothetical protein